MRHMKTICGVLFLSVLFLSQNTMAACPPGLTCGAATVYEVTIQQIELCTGTTGTDCQGAAVVGSGTLSVDIASAASGAQVATYGTVDNLQPNTTYTHVRVTVGTSFNISGSTALPAGVGGVTGCFTNGGSGTITSPLVIASDLSPATTSTLAVVAPGVIPGVDASFYANLGMVHNGATMTVVAALPTPVTITTTMPSIDVAFDTSEGLGATNWAGNCALFPAPPTISVTVD